MEQALLPFIERVGLPGALLLVAAWWFAPRVDLLFKATTENATTLKVMDVRVETHQADIKAQLLEIKGKVDAVLVKLAKDEE